MLTRDDLTARLRHLELALPEPAPAKGRYRSAVVDGGRLWVSGHTGRSATVPAAAGSVGQDLTVEEGRASARLAAVNLIAAAVSAVPPERLARLLFLRGYVRTSADFGEHPAVIDAASEVLDHVLGGGGHARAAIGVRSLPGGACVELEAVFGLHPDG